MCTKENSSSNTSQLTMYPLVDVEHYRLQLYQYAVAAQRLYPQYTGYPPRLAISLFNPRGIPPEEPKPQHSYIGLIAMAILSSPDYKLVLSDIYQYILDHYAYFRTRGPGWRNSIRHNLSLNDCFVKAGRSANGKGHYWAIHPANVEDFKKGDFRRRKAQRKVRKHMGLAVEDDGTDSPSPPPQPPPPPLLSTSPQPAQIGGGRSSSSSPLIRAGHIIPCWPLLRPTQRTKKRQFDVASLLAPEPADDNSRLTMTTTRSDDEELDVGGPTLPPWPYHNINQQLMARYYQTHC